MSARRLRTRAEHKSQVKALTTFSISQQTGQRAAEPTSLHPRLASAASSQACIGSYAPGLHRLAAGTSDGQRPRQVSQLCCPLSAFPELQPHRVSFQRWPFLSSGEAWGGVFQKTGVAVKREAVTLVSSRTGNSKKDTSCPWRLSPSGVDTDHHHATPRHSCLTPWAPATSVSHFPPF